jgi:hypothetical protein
MKLRVVATLAPNLLLAALASVAFVANGPEQAPPLWPDVDDMTAERVTAEREAQPVNVPTWTADLAARFPGCRRADGSLADLVVVDSAAVAHRVTFDWAWKITHNDNPYDNVWVVGSCPAR